MKRSDDKKLCDYAVDVVLDAKCPVPSSIPVRVVFTCDDSRTYVCDLGTVDVTFEDLSLSLPVSRPEKLFSFILVPLESTFSSLIHIFWCGIGVIKLRNRMEVCGHSIIDYIRCQRWLLFTNNGYHFTPVRGCHEAPVSFSSLYRQSSTLK